MKISHNYNAPAIIGFEHYEKIQRNKNVRNALIAFYYYTHVRIGGRKSRNRYAVLPMRTIGSTREKV